MQWTAQTAQQQGRYLARVFSQLGEKNVLEAEIAHIRKQPAAQQDKDRLRSLVKAHEAALTIKPFHVRIVHPAALTISTRIRARLPTWAATRRLGASARYAVADSRRDFPAFGSSNFAAAGMATYVVWRSAYLSKLFSLRNRLLVGTDWLKCKILGRDISRA